MRLIKLIHALRAIRFLTNSFDTMAKNYYSKYTLKELSEVYITTKDNYGKIDGELLEEINDRGGETAFRIEVEEAKVEHAEKVRVVNEVIDLTGKESNPDFLKTLIRSEIIPQTELHEIIVTTHAEIIARQRNRKVTSGTIVGCIVGIVLGSFLGVIILYLQSLYLEKIYYYSLVLVYAASFIIIRIPTKQNAANIMVLISALIATIISPVIFALYFNP